MASLLKVWCTRKDADGSKIRERSKNWYGQYKDADGRTVRKPLCEDKTASQAMLMEMIRKANLVRSGLVDKYDDQRKRPLAEHLKEFEESVAAKGGTVDHVALLLARINRIVGACRFKRVGDLDGAAVERFLAELKAKGMSVQTANHYIRAIKQFSRWLQLDRRTNDNPLFHLRTGNARCDIRIDRREITGDEIAWLLTTTRTGAMRSTLTGEQRFMLYAVALGTGLRASELASLTPRSFDLDNDQPTVTIDASDEKARRGATLPLPSDLVALLTPWLAGHSPKAILWPGKWAKQKHAGKMMRFDLQAAKRAWTDEVKDDPDASASRMKSDFLEYTTSDGKQADFHSLRHTYLSRLARSKASPKVMQLLARHSTVELTLGRYAHASLVDLAAAVAALPALPMATQATVKLRATGS